MIKFLQLRLLFSCISIIISSIALAQDQKATVMTTKSPDQLYLGAVLQQKSINAKTHKVLDIIQDDIVVSFGGMPVKSKTIKSEKAAFDNAVAAALQQSNGTPQGNSSFSFDIKELKSYDAISLYFGQTLDVADWFSVYDVVFKPRTLLAVNIERVEFTVAMDLPTEGMFKTNKVLLDQFDSNDLIYVNSLSFGRRAVVFVESNLDAVLVKNAVSAILKRQKLSSHEQGVLANCNFRVALLGSKDVIDIDGAHPLSQVLDYLDAKTNASHSRVPIAFGASYLRNNQLFSNSY